MNPKDGTARTIVAPAESDEAQDATTDQPGKNTRYGAEAAEEEPQEEQPVEEPVAQTSWIGIEVVDSDEKPVPGAYYEITAKDGKVYDGTTDADGCARIEPIAPGTCQVCFPKIDGREWTYVGTTNPD